MGLVKAAVVFLITFALFFWMMIRFMRLPSQQKKLMGLRGLFFLVCALLTAGALWLIVKVF